MSLHPNLSHAVIGQSDNPPLNKALLRAYNDFVAGEDYARHLECWLSRGVFEQAVVASDGETRNFDFLVLALEGDMAFARDGTKLPLPVQLRPNVQAARVWSTNATQLPWASCSASL